MLKGWLFFLGSFFLTSSAFAVAPDVNGDGDREFLLWNGASGVFRAIDSSGRLFQRQCGLPGDIPLFSNLEGDARSEMTVWRPATQPGQPSTFYVCRDSGVATISLGSSGDRPFSQFDFDGDDRTDFTVYRPATAQWFISRSNQGGALDVRTWGQEGDVPVPGDYDGDGLADIGVFRPREGTWWIVQSATNSLKNVAWGLPHDIPVPRDYDGDNKVDIATWRPHEGKWYIRPSLNENSPIIRQFGLVEDVPIPTDMNGDGHADLVIYRPYNGLVFWVTDPVGSTFALQLTTGFLGEVVPMLSRNKLATGGDYDGDGRADYALIRNQSGQLSWIVADSLGRTLLQQPWGLVGDTVTPGDFSGDGRTDLVVSRAVSSGNVQWFVKPTQGAELNFFFGLTGDRSVVGDYDGDGRSDAVVVRTSGGGLTWYSRNSGDIATTSRSWGLSGDQLVTSDFTGDGKSDYTVVRNSGGFLNWFTLTNDGRALTTVLWGLPGDTLVPGDYDGDGRDDYGVVRNIGGALYLFVRFQSGGVAEMVQWGLAGDSVLPGRYDGGLTLQQAVWRSVTNSGPSYFVERATSILERQPSSISQFAFGLATDLALPPGQTVQTIAPPPPPPPPPPTSGGGGSPPSGLPCSTIRELAYPDLWKKGSSSHIPGADSRTGKPSFIGAKNRSPRPAGVCVDILDSEGNKLSAFGKYAVGGVYEFRYYVGTRIDQCGGGHTAEEINRRALTNTGNPTIYLHKSPGLCLRISGGALTPRQGSVR